MFMSILQDIWQSAALHTGSQPDITFICCCNAACDSCLHFLASSPTAVSSSLSLNLDTNPAGFFNAMSIVGESHQADIINHIDIKLMFFCITLLVYWAC